MDQLPGTLQWLDRFVIPLLYTLHEFSASIRLKKSWFFHLPGRSGECCLLRLPSSCRNLWRSSIPGCRFWVAIHRSLQKQWWLGVKPQATWQKLNKKMSGISMIMCKMSVGRNLHLSMNNLKGGKKGTGTLKWFYFDFSCSCTSSCHF